MLTTTPDAQAGLGRNNDHAKINHRYRQAAPFLLLWGVIMFFANGINQFVPPMQQGLTWGVFCLGGIVASSVMGRRFRQSPKFNWRYLATVAVIFVFIGAAMVVLHPSNPLQINVFIKLLFCFFYVVGGIWLGLRFFVTGLLVGALTLFAYFDVTAYFNLFMAVAYGGALILTGLWLRKA